MTRMDEMHTKLGFAISTYKEIACCAHWCKSLAGGHMAFGPVCALGAEMHEDSSLVCTLVHFKGSKARGLQPCMRIVG